MLENWINTCKERLTVLQGQVKHKSKWAIRLTTTYVGKKYFNMAYADDPLKYLDDPRVKDVWINGQSWNTDFSKVKNIYQILIS